MLEVEKWLQTIRSVQNELEQVERELEDIHGAACEKLLDAIFNGPSPKRRKGR